MGPGRVRSQQAALTEPGEPVLRQTAGQVPLQVDQFEVDRVHREVVGDCQYVRPATEVKPSATAHNSRRPTSEPAANPVWVGPFVLDGQG